MTLRTPLAFIAAAVFGFLMLVYVAPGAFMNQTFSETGQTIDELAGSEAAVAVTNAVRTIAIPMIVLSLALVEWGGIAAAYEASQRRAISASVATQDEGHPD